MNPNVSGELARIRLAELHRQAAAARLARSVAPHAPASSETGRMRAAIGSGLVRLGVRLGGRAAME